MKRIKVMGLCLVAVFAFSATAVATASAEVLLHTYKACVKAVPKESGKYNDKACTILSKGVPKAKEGGYELANPTGDTYASKSKVSTLYVYIPAEETILTGGAVAGKVTCKTSKGTGSYKSELLTESVITFKTCTSEGKKCTSAGDPAGSITTFPLSTEPVLWLGKVELLTYAAAAKGATEKETLEKAQSTPSAIFSCEGLESITTNTALGTAEGNVGTSQKAGHDVLNVNEKTGAQEDVFFEGMEVGPFQAFLLAHVTPPGVTLPAGENTNQELKGKVAVGIYPS
jgi:hypothetical protein